ncbi:MAG: thiamine phosphate synthase [Duncaniella sp.]|nr:thiamine phosphate synthase [Duncaniella sp.]
MKPMIRIAITPEGIDERNEASDVAAILRSGWDRVHLRHPGASRRDMINLLESIPQTYHNRLVLHGHFDLMNEFNLGGLHLNHRCPEPPALYHGALSKSCHTINEVMEASESGKFGYVTLSPIFDSISKSGYKSRFSAKELSLLSGITALPVIALGGIDLSRLETIRLYGFDGFAMLGALPWGDTHEMERITKQIICYNS